MRVRAVWPRRSTSRPIERATDVAVSAAENLDPNDNGKGHRRHSQRLLQDPSNEAELQLLSRHGYRTLAVASGPPGKMVFVALVALNEPAAA